MTDQSAVPVQRCGSIMPMSRSFVCRQPIEHIVQSSMGIELVGFGGGVTDPDGVRMRYAYDEADRLVRICDGTHNARGERVWVEARGGMGGVARMRERIVHDESGRRLETRRLQPDSVQSLIWLDQLPVAVVQDGVVHAIEADHLGTPRLARDLATGEVSWRWDIFGSAFGGHAAENRGLDLALRFPGQYHDPATGLHYNYFRDYDPSTGRYVQSDPIGLAGGMNTYGYVHASPLMLIDPKGLDALCGAVAHFVPDPGTSVWDRRGHCNPDDSGNDRVCVTGDCVFFPPTTNNQANRCRYECNLKFQPVCSGLGALATVTAGPEAGIPAAGTCVVAKLLVCELKCQVDEMCTSEPPQPPVIHFPNGQCSTGSTDCLLYGGNWH